MSAFYRIALVALVATALAGAAWAAPAVGTEVPGMRTEYSRTYIQADGQYTTQMFTTPIHAKSPSGGWVPVDVDSVRNCYPQSLPDWTGHVQLQSSSYTKNGGDMYFKGAQSSSQIRAQAWCKFDLSPIPDGATLTTAYFGYYCYQIGEIPTTTVRLVTSDPVPASATTLYSQITTGTQVASVYGHGTGWQYRSLNSTGVAAVQSRLSTDWVALGLHSSESNNSAWGLAYGFGGGPGGGYKPYLSVSYSPPPVTDISVEDVIAPSGTMEPGPVIPMGRWRNRQPHPESFTAYFFMENPSGLRVYRESLTVASLGPMRDTVLVFTQHIAADTGNWITRCSTHAVGDIDPLNDFRYEGFRVAVHVPGIDVGVLGVLEPVLWVDTGTTVVPAARWMNFSSLSAEFVAYMIIENPAKARLYSRVSTVSGLAPGRDTTLVFPGFSVGADTGKWTVICSTFAARDTHAANDAYEGTFTVFAGVPRWRLGWTEYPSIPAMPSGKDIKDGGWMTIDPATGLVYAAKGYNTGDFYSYDPEGDTWHALSRWREGIEGKMSKKGAVGAADGAGHIYAVKGSSTSGFWRYDIMGDSWSQLRDVPLGGDNKKIKGGSDLACVNLNGEEYVYLLKGGKNQFYRYIPLNDSWEMLQEAPAGASLKWNKGSWLAYDEATHTLYAHKAKKHELWTYDIVAGGWAPNQLNAIPYTSRIGKTKKSKDGGSGVWFSGCLYALKGGNTNEFWRYFVEGDSWSELDTMPQIGSAGKKKRVKGGGDLVVLGEGRFLATKGNKCREVWHYYRPDLEPGGRMGRAADVSAGVRLNVWPNPTRDQASVRYSLPGLADVRVDVLNAAGQVVYSRTMVRTRSGTVPVSGLRTGIYLVRLSAGGRVLSGKLVVGR